MKERIAAIVFLLALSTSAFCTKLFPQEDTSVLSKGTFLSKKAKPSVFTSDWESVTKWSSEKNKTGTTYYFSRSTPELSDAVLKNGVVVLFARNLWAGEAMYKNMGAADKPLKMPFYYLPYMEKPNYTEQWSYEANANKIDVVLDVKGNSEKTSPNSNIQFRYIIIPQEVIAQKGKTISAVRQMSYNEIIQTFNQ